MCVVGLLRACSWPLCMPVQHRGLLYCMEYLEENLDDWLGQELQVRPASHQKTNISMHGGLVCATPMWGMQHQCLALWHRCTQQGALHRARSPAAALFVFSDREPVWISVRGVAAAEPGSSPAAKADPGC